MAHLRRLGKPGAYRYQVRFTDPQGTERAKTFTLKGDADRFLTHVQHDLHSGSYVDPRAGRLPFGPFAERWLARQGHLKQTSRERYESTLHTHLLPAWKLVPLSGITRASAQEWLHSIDRSASTVKQAYTLLCLILDNAVEEGQLRSNPVRGIKLAGTKSTKPNRYLTHEQVVTLAAAPGTARDRLLIKTLAYSGIRFGEAIALRASSVLVPQNRLLIFEATAQVKGGRITSTPKNHKTREVPVSPELMAELAAHIADLEPDQLVFSTRTGGGVWRRNWHVRVLAPAAATIGIPDLHPHELRHTAVSLAIAAGADVNAVQRMCGHASPMMTLNVYSHLFDEALDRVAEAVGRAAREASDGLLADSKARMTPTGQQLRGL